MATLINCAHNSCWHTTRLYFRNMPSAYLSPLIPLKICDLTAAYPLVIDVSMFLLGEFPLCTEMTHHRFSLPRKNNYYRLKEINNKNVRGLLIYLCISLFTPPLPPLLLVILHASCAITWFRARPISFPLSSFVAWMSPFDVRRQLWQRFFPDWNSWSAARFSLFSFLSLICFCSLPSFQFYSLALGNTLPKTFTLLRIRMAVCQFNTE